MPGWKRNLNHENHAMFFVINIRSSWFRSWTSADNLDDEWAQKDL